MEMPGIHHFPAHHGAAGFKDEVDMQTLHQAQQAASEASKEKEEELEEVLQPLGQNPLHGKAFHCDGGQCWMNNS